MKKKNTDSDEPRDEFDHIAIPSFVAKPFEMLSGRAAPAPQPRPRPADAEGAGQRGYDETDESDRDPVYGDSIYGDSTRNGAAYNDPAYGDADEPRDTRPLKWWQGPRGKIAAYAAGTIILFFLQTRG
jgi:hypothetical protein